MPYNQRISLMSEEDRAIRDENLEHRPFYDDEGIRRLMAAVCLRGIADYRKAVKRIWLCRNGDVRRDAERRKAECEQFFDSGMFTEITGMSGKEEAVRAILRIPNGYESALERRK